MTTVHAVTVILWLLYIPFGELFHIYQRPGTVGLAYTRARWADEPVAHCLRPGTDSALLSGMLHHVIERDLLDHDFIAAHTEGFEAAAQAVHLQAHAGRRHGRRRPRVPAPGDQTCRPHEQDCLLGH